MKFDACIASARQTAGTVVITTKDAIFYGISATGSAAAAIIVVHPGITTGTAPAFYFTIAATAATNDSPMAPVVCKGGITCTNVGTLVNYVVYYADL